MHGWRLKIGILTPANNVVLEPEFYSHLPEGVAVYTTRMLTSGTHSLEGLVAMEQNANRGVLELAATAVDVIAYACLSTSLAKGPGWSESFVEDVRRVTGLPATTAATATMDALREFDVRKVAIGSPFPDSIALTVKPFFQNHGFSIVSEKNLNVGDEKEIGRIGPDAIYDLGHDVDVKEAEAVCLLATDVSTLDIVEALERDIGKPVVTTNQAILWEVLRLGGIETSIPHVGRLLAGRDCPGT
jgi:maleate cis-trans isomerase